MKNLFENISESEKDRIIKMHLDATKRLYLNEQQSEDIRQGGGGDPYQYKKVGDKYFYAKKGDQNWVAASNPKAIEAIRTKIFGVKSTTPITPKSAQPKTTQPAKTEKVPQMCPVLSSSSRDIEDLNKILALWKSFDKINEVINKWAVYYKSSGITDRVSCQIALNKIRPAYKDKNLIIIDSLQHLIYIFAPDGKFIAKSEMISGKNKQSQSPEVIAQALKTTEETAKDLGFKWDPSQRKFVDTTGKGRKFSNDLIYDMIDKTKSRFLPKGTYTTSSKIESDPEYAGRVQNLIHLMKGDKVLNQAIHGYYLEAPRTKALAVADKVISNPNDPKVSKEFLDLISGGKVNLSYSYGCINVPTDFVDEIRKYAANAYVFNIGETGNNYLVDNVENFFEKMTTQPSCPSPRSLGAENPINFA